MQAGLRIDEIARITGGKVQGNAFNKIVSGISTDTRTIKRGDLFIALKGKNFDGHDFISDAFRGGAYAAIAQKNFRNENKRHIIIKVNDTLKSLGDIAAYWRSRFNIDVIGITGSNGKTTTKELAASVLSRRYNLLSTEGNLNNLIGVPQMLLKLADEHEMAVLEFGSSRFGEIERLAEIAKPNIGIITNIAPAHLEYFKSIKGVLKEKIQLGMCLQNGLLIFNKDDELLSGAQHKLKCAKLTFGFSPKSDVRCIKIISQRENGTHFRVKTAQFVHDFSINLAGRHNILNALAAISCGIYYNLEPEEINKGLISVFPLKGRWQTFKGVAGSTIIDDSYNANPASVITGLKELTGIYSKKRISIVLGDMLELGRETERIHYDIGKKISHMNIFRLITIGTMAQNIASGALSAGFPRDRVFITQSKDSAIEWLKMNLNQKDIIYIKGSRGMRMEEIVRGLEVK